MQTLKLKRAPAGVYEHPVIGRMCLEVSRSGSICVASNTPVFESSRGTLIVPDLMAHVKARITSDTFVGMALVCLTETEDLCERLDLAAHVFRERLVILRPTSASILELCMLLSMMENARRPSLQLLESLVSRARFLYTRAPSADSALLLHSIEKVAATVAHINDLHDAPENFGSPLPGFQLAKCLQNADLEAQGLLRPLFLESHKMPPDDEDAESGAHGTTFNMFYLETALTKHFVNGTVVAAYREACLTHLPKPQLVL